MSAGCVQLCVPVAASRASPCKLRNRVAPAPQGTRLIVFIGNHAGRCLKPLLDALGWRGEERHLLESLPHFDNVEDIDSLRSVLARLNYETTARRARLCDLTEDILPCLFRPQGSDNVLVVLERDENRVADIRQCHRRSNRGASDISDVGTVYLVEEADLELQRNAVMRHGWVAVMLGRFKLLLWQLLGMTFIINACSRSRCRSTP